MQIKQKNQSKGEGDHCEKKTIALNEIRAHDELSKNESDGSIGGKVYWKTQEMN